MMVWEQWSAYEYFYKYGRCTLHKGRYCPQLGDQLDCYLVALWMCTNPLIIIVVNLPGTHMFHTSFLS